MSIYRVLALYFPKKVYVVFVKEHVSKKPPFRHPSSRSLTPRILRCYGIYQQDMAQHKDMMPYNGPIWQNLMDGFEFLLLLFQKKCRKNLVKVEVGRDCIFFETFFTKTQGYIKQTNTGGETRISICKIIWARVGKKTLISIEKKVSNFSYYFLLDSMFGFGVQTRMWVCNKERDHTVDDSEIRLTTWDGAKTLQKMG